tara:strand:+ start:153 stop:485 length:333 start_codon:yes stop_codon:yes gene_type:complete
MAKPSTGNTNGKISLTYVPENLETTTAEKKVSDSTIGKVMRQIVITFEEGALSARNSQNGNLACNGRGVDQNGIKWNITTCMPLDPSTNKAVKTEDADLDGFLGIDQETT